MLAQAEHIPVHLGSMPASVAGSDRPIRIRSSPGSNTPSTTHTRVDPSQRPDPGAAGTPDHALVGWVANRAHHADVGGEAPGSMPAARCHPRPGGMPRAAMAAVRSGSWLDDFREPFLAATRTPAERLGDLSAQLGANEVGCASGSCVLPGPACPDSPPMSAALLDYGERTDARRPRRPRIGRIPLRGLHGVGTSGWCRSRGGGSARGGCSSRLHRDRFTGGGQHQRRRRR